MKHLETLLDDIISYGATKEDIPEIAEIKPEIVECVTMDDVEGISHFLEMTEDVLIHLWVRYDISPERRKQVDDKIRQITWLLEDALIMLEGRYPRRVMKVKQRLENIEVERLTWNATDDEGY